VGKEGCGEAGCERGETYDAATATNGDGRRGRAREEGRAEVDEADEGERCRLRRDSAAAEGGEGVDLGAVGGGGREWG
jgi:hypothetical protein